MKYIKLFKQLDNPAISEVGGKGANLGILTAHMFPVPAGFCITTEGYQDYVRYNNLEETMSCLLNEIQTDFRALEGLSAKIRELFSAGAIPSDIKDEIIGAYQNLNMIPVAVRSSATAEDLPGMSFAGQQDTFLNICGTDNLLKAVVNCWSSLWTARAIGYRDKNGINQKEVALSVVVQQMVESDVSGVMFTANPLNGNRGQTVIDASFGLGEALVSGQVEPDNYIVNRLDKKITIKTLGDKALSIRSDKNGGLSTHAEETSGLQALSDDNILQLAELGWEIEQIYHCPQDIEWGLVEGKFYILQSRPITSLFPELFRYEAGDLFHDPQDKKIFYSFASWQVMLDPITPMGRDVFYSVAAGIGSELGYNINRQNQKVFATASERLFVNFTPLFKNKFGRNFVTAVISSLSPAEAELIKDIFSEPEFACRKSKLSLSKKVKLALAFFGMVKTAASLNLNPSKGMTRLAKKIERKFSYFENNTYSVKETDDFERFFDQILIKGFAGMFNKLPAYVASGQIPYQALLRIVSEIPDCEGLINDLTRGVRNNVTTEMDLELWQVAVQIKNDPISFEQFLHADVEILSQNYLQKKLPEPAQVVLANFFNTYGARGIGEIDVGRKRWAEDPTQIMQVLKSYLELEESVSPQLIFDQNEKKAEEALTLLLNKVTESNLNPLKKRAARFFARRVRQLTGLRESPKFTIVKIIKIIRDKLLKLAQTAYQNGSLHEPEDIFFLYIHELHRLSAADPGLKLLIEKRKAVYASEKNRRSLPTLVAGNGTYYLAPPIDQPSGEGSLAGTPVSAGVVEGVIRVVLDPRVTRLMPGEIMVCPATDPGWTPLFLVASGLIMEVGGVMTHGSVVAREYGIPAIVGVKKATELLKTGQRVRLNGNNGTVEIILVK